MKKKIAIASVLLVALSSAAFAQFFGLTMTYSPTEIVELAKHFQQMLQEYQLLQQTYATTVSTYKQLEANAQMITSKDGWRYAASPLMYPSSPDAYGTSGGWISAINKGANTVGAYDAATVRWSNPSALSSKLSADMRKDLGTYGATVELNDAIAAHLMGVTGSARANYEAQQRALESLQRDSLSNDPAMNTQVGVLNKLNQASLSGAMVSQEQLKVLTALADAQAVSMKERHDAMVTELNYSAAAADAAKGNANGIWGGHAHATDSSLP